MLDTTSNKLEATISLFDTFTNISLEYISSQEWKSAPSGVASRFVRGMF